ncbi:MAG: Fe-S cluster assembly protein SufD [Porphyromonas sp.]|nr:Fe-S cluster assembly protein SufD [Porphyromonas sp.]
MKKSKRQELQRSLARQFLERHQPGQAHPVMEQWRPMAKTALIEEGLPVYREEDYKYFKIDQFLSEDRHITITPKLSSEETKAYACRLTYPDVHQAYLVGGRVSSTVNSQEFFVGSIDDFELKHPGVAAKYYNQMASARKAPLTQLNTLYAQDLFVLHIPKGVKVEKPIHLIHYAGTAAEVSTLTFPRILVIAEANSSATLLLCDHGNTDTDSAYIGAIEIYAQKGAGIHYYNVEETGTHSLRLMDTHIHQEQDSNVVVDSITMQNGTTRNNYYCDLAGENAHLDLDGLGLLDGDKQLDSWSLIRHSVPNCFSDELFKYTMNDSSVGAFSGRIYVAKDAQKTMAYQNNRNLLLSDKAKMYSKPQLEIYADDVKCSHGMTTGELDDLAIFYLQQRGIPKMEARLMLTAAFMTEVLDKITYQPLRERLEATLDKRYRGIPSNCKQ